VDLRRGEVDAERVLEDGVDAEGDECGDRRPEERRPYDRRQRLGGPWRTVEPALEVGRAEADPACHKKAEARGGNEEHEVADEREEHELAQRCRRWPLWAGSDRLQPQKVGDDERSGERAGGREERERPPGIGTG
jgi:hypothetical protein